MVSHELSGKDHRDRTARLGGKALLLGIVLAVCSVVALMIVFWPFQRHSVVQILQEMSDSQVQIQGFHATYFPSPGCTLDGVEFRHGDAASKPLITIEKLTIQGELLRSSVFSTSVTRHGRRRAHRRSLQGT